MAMPKELEQTLKAINKRYGEGTITTANKAVSIKLKRISSGSFALDCEIGGGFPEGRITLLTGDFSSGKSFVAYKAISEAQKKYPNKIAILIDQEGAFDADWAETLGVDLERLEIVRPATAEQAYDIMTALMQSPHISMIVLDSLAAMTSNKELEKSMEDSQAMGGNAKINNEFLRKAQAILNMGSLEQEKEQPAIIIINQLRDSMDMYSPEVIPGGRGQKFFSSILIKIRRGEKFIEKQEDGREVYVGHEVKFKVEKNKTFPPHRQGTFDIYVAKSNKGFKAGDIDRLKEVVMYAIYWGIIKRAGSWMTILDNPEWKFQGSTRVIEFLRENEDVLEEVERQVMAIALTTRRNSGDEPTSYVLDDGREIDPDTGEILSDNES